jgi:N-acetylglucosamine-6-phosphate deacetylase
MDTAVGNTVRFSDATLGEALEMATSQPARLLGVEADRGLIAAGRAADVLLFDWDEAAAGLGVRAMVINGEIVYRRDEH